MLQFDVITNKQYLKWFLQKTTNINVLIRYNFNLNSLRYCVQISSFRQNDSYSTYMDFILLFNL